MASVPSASSPAFAAHSFAAHRYAHPSRSSARSSPAGSPSLAFVQSGAAAAAAALAFFVAAGKWLCPLPWRFALPGIALVGL